MRRLLLPFVLVIACSLALAATSLGGGASRPGPVDHAAAGDGPDPSVQLARAQAVVEYAIALDRQQVGDYVTSLMVADVVRYIDAQNAAAATVAAIPSPGMSSPVSSRGAHSDAWWRGIATCEQGGENDSFFGYFSIMDGSAGGLDWSTQVAMANGIISRYGDSAWAASCVAMAYGASPGG